MVISVRSKPNSYLLIDFTLRSSSNYLFAYLSLMESIRSSDFCWWLKKRLVFRLLSQIRSTDLDLFLWGLHFSIIDLIVGLLVVRKKKSYFTFFVFIFFFLEFDGVDIYWLSLYFYPTNSWHLQLYASFYFYYHFYYSVL